MLELYKVLKNNPGVSVKVEAHLTIDALVFTFSEETTKETRAVSVTLTKNDMQEPRNVSATLQNAVKTLKECMIPAHTFDSIVETVNNSFAIDTPVTTKSFAADPTERYLRLQVVSKDQSREEPHSGT